MKKSIITMGIIVTIGSIALLYDSNKKEVLLNKEEITNNKSIAIYVKQEDGNYEKTNTIPESGYILNEEKSVCSNNSKPSWNINTKSLKINNLNSNNTSCYLYFDSYCKPEDTACQTILANKEVKVRDKITGPLTDNTTGKMYAAEDDDGMSYYFAGQVDNNFIKFAGYYWRIVRINGDGTIRIIYNGPTTSQTGETTQIGTSAFNDDGKDNAYVGYMYGTPGSSTYEETHANINDSTIKKVIDNWYETNIANNSNFVNKIDVNAGFCNDRKVYEGENWTEFGTAGYNNNKTTYIFTSKILKWQNGDSIIKSIANVNLYCNNENDLFTLNNASKGNKALKYPIGLLTADEVFYLGNYMDSNAETWLKTSLSYWTMTPFRKYDTADIFLVDYVNNSYGWGCNDYLVGVRPVINLKSDVVLTGTGTKDNPYIVEGAE